MSIITELEKKKDQLDGRTITSGEESNLKQKLPASLIPDWYIFLLKNFPLVGVSFCLEEEDDKSEMGADLKWFGPDEIIDESSLMYPGKAVATLGYLPVASCLTGSGDPYFLNLKDNKIDNPKLMRIPHDFASDSGYPEDAIEVVSESLSDFFSLAVVE